MILSDNKQLPTINHSNINGKFWTISIPININAYNEQICKLEYKYSIYNSLTKTAVWEREPNRTCNIITNINSTNQKEYFANKNNNVKLLINSHLLIHDENFVSLFKYDKIGKLPLYVGPYPQNNNDLMILKNIGIKVILNLQSDDDIKYRQIDINNIISFCKDNNIEIIRVPIHEQSQSELECKLKNAADVIHNALDNNNKCIYVHCTSGMNRSIDVIVMYLVLYKEYTLQQAGEYVKMFRRIACVNYKAIQNALYKENPEKYPNDDVNIISTMSCIDNNNDNVSEDSDDEEN
jgi:protein-tyrosine phosphatase